MVWEDILAEIKRTLKEPTADGHWADDELLRRANLVQKDVCRKTEFLEKVAELVYNDVGNYYCLPSDCLRICSVVYNNKRLIGTTEQQLDDNYLFCGKLWREAVGEPKHYFQEFNTVNLFPKPASVDNIILRYKGVAKDMVASCDKPFEGVCQLQSAVQTIIDGVVCRCMLEDGNAGMADRYNSLYLQGIKDIKRLSTNTDEVTEYIIARPRF